LVREVISTSSCVAALKTVVAQHTWACDAVLALTTTRPSGRSPKLEALERMADEKDPRVGKYLTFPELSVLRAHPRMPALRRKLGLPN
jgi:hypothetical protein